MDQGSSRGTNRNKIMPGRKHDWFTYTGDCRWPHWLSRSDKKLWNRTKRRKIKGIWTDHESE